MLKQFVSMRSFSIWAVLLVFISVEGRFEKRSAEEHESGLQARWRRGLSRKDTVPVLTANQNSCGQDSICISDLDIRGILEMEREKTGRIKWIAGKTSSIKVYMVIANYGEPAADATLTVEFPSFIQFARVGYDGRMYSCKPSNSKVVCSIGNPFPGGSQVSFGMQFLALPTSDTTTSFDIILKLQTSGVEIVLENNNVVLHVDLLE